MLPKRDPSTQNGNLTYQIADVRAHNKNSHAQCTVNNCKNYRCLLAVSAKSRLRDTKYHADVILVFGPKISS